MIQLKLRNDRIGIVFREHVLEVLRPLKAADKKCDFSGKEKKCKYTTKHSRLMRANNGKPVEET